MRRIWDKRDVILHDHIKTKYRACIFLGENGPWVKMVTTSPGPLTLSTFLTIPTSFSSILVCRIAKIGNVLQRRLSDDSRALLSVTFPFLNV